MYGDHKTYLGKTTDGGKTWSLIKSNEFTGFAHKIKEDFINKNLLFLGTEMGLFATVDGGENWFRMKNHIPDYTLVRDIQIHPRTNDLLLATHGRGIIVVDDITPMRNLTKDIIDKEVVLFDSKPIVLTPGKYGDGGFPSTGGWNGGNPPSVQPIQYYFKERMSTGDVAVEIYDATGKLVQTVPGTKRKGVNKVYWNLRMTPPKVATGGTKIDFGSFTAPMVLPGDYTVKLKVGDKEYTQSVKLMHDNSNPNFTTADRQAQYKTAMDLYHLHEQLAGVVDGINSNQKMLKENIEKTKNAKLKKLLTEYNDKLETLRETLLASKQKSQFADEQKLRERISDVYVAVCSQEAGPSNLQVQRVSVLSQEVQKASQDNIAINNHYAIKVKQALIKEGLLKDEKSTLDNKKGN